MARAFMSTASARALARRITAVTGHLEPGMARPKVVVTRQLGADAMRLLDRPDLDVRLLSSFRDDHSGLTQGVVSSLVLGCGMALRGAAMR